MSPREQGFNRRAFIGGAAALTVGAAAQQAAAHQRNGPRPRERTNARVEALLARMTLADKIGQLNIPQVLPQPFLPETSPTGSDANRERYARGTWRAGVGPGGGFFGLMNESIFGALPIERPRSPREQAQLANELQRAARSTRLGIPLLQVAEGTNGFAAPGGTTFPEGPGTAASWNVRLVESIYAAIAREARAVGVHVLNTLVAETMRDPRFGRGQEGYGEDPHLVGEIVGAVVRGAQGRSVAAPDRAVASLCHYPVQAPNDGGLEGSAVQLGERELRESHLGPWQTGFAEEGALMTLACQSTIDGVPTHASEWLLTDVLRGEFDFRGVVIAEGGGLGTLVKEGVAETQKEAGALALRAGVDVGITWEEAYLDGLEAAVRDGTVPMRLVDRAVRRVLMLKLELGLFDRPFVDPARAAQIVHCRAHRELALQAGRESIVLLKNDGGVLPLAAAARRIAVIGPNADEASHLLGDYCPAPPLEPVPSILDGIRAKAGWRATVTYERGCEILGEDRSGFAAAVAAAEAADVAVVVVGEKAKGFLHRGATDGEGRDVVSLDLTGVQEELIRAVHATGTPTVVVLVTGRPLSIRWTADNVPAIVNAWLPGECGGAALADVLFGACDPGGRMPVTVPRHVGQLPITSDLRRMRVESSGYVDMPATPLWEFGFGLSYTTFSYTNLRISRRRLGRGGTTDVLVDVTNTGTRRGQEVVQLYLTDTLASVSVPAKRLRGFAKVDLAPGRTETVRMTLGPRELALVDRDMRTVVEPGRFEVAVGSSSERIALRGSFEVIGR